MSSPPAVCWHPGQWLGGLREASDIRWLKEHGIRRVITCAVEIDKTQIALDGDIEWIRFEMEDAKKKDDWGRIQDVMWYYLEDAVRKVEESLERGIPTLLHCVQGWQRSPTVLVCVLVKRYGWEPRGVISMMRNFREGSFEKECHFESLILEWGRRQFFNLKKK